MNNHYASITARSKTSNRTDDAALSSKLLTGPQFTHQENGHRLETTQLVRGMKLWGHECRYISKNEVRETK